jgi:hypothetical protein
MQARSVALAHSSLKGATPLMAAAIKLREVSFPKLFAEAA